jgi:serine/threonine protein kinase
MHDAGLVHGTLSISTVLIDSRGAAKVMNAGTCGHTPGSRVLLPHVSPAVAAGMGKATFGCDLWALGVLLHTLAYNKLPPRGQPGGSPDNTTVRLALRAPSSEPAVWTPQGGVQRRLALRAPSLIAPRLVLVTYLETVRSVNVQVSQRGVKLTNGIFAPPFADGAPHCRRDNTQGHEWRVFRGERGGKGPFGFARVPTGGRVSEWESLPEAGTRTSLARVHRFPQRQIDG